MNASKKEAKAAWKRLVSEHHPDRHPPHLRASKSKKMMLINVAYEEFCDPDYLKKQSRRQSGRAKSTTAESRQKPPTKYTYTFDAKRAKDTLDAFRPALNDSFAPVSSWAQKEAWKHLFLNMLRLKFRFGKTLPILVIVPHRFILEVENRHLIVFSGCYTLRMSIFYLLIDGFYFKDAGNTRRKIHSHIIACVPRDHAPPHATPYGFKVAEFDSPSPYLDRITLIYEVESTEAYGPRTHRIFFRPSNGLLRFYWKRVYYSDSEVEAGVRPDF